jgi:hypothetical protein
MLKVRLMGTPNDIRWFEKLMERHKKVKVIRISEKFENKGTKRYFRKYMEVDRKEGE